MNAQALLIFGLFLTLIGAGLLFIYGLPTKKIGSVFIFGVTAISFVEEPNEPSIPSEEWQPKANAFLRRAKQLNRTGFGLIATGTFLQMIAVYF
jgi:hypothetical protein